MTNAIPKVYAAISAVTADLAVEGITKERKNQQQGYNFRGIDDVYNALSPILSRNKLVMLPRILSRDVTERATAKGNPLFFVVVEAEFDLISSEDGSKHTIRTFGEAMDSADKATNKAMSAAYKYAAMQTFAIPTEGDNDADAVTHEVAPKPKAKTRDLYAEMQAELDACSTVEELGMLWASKPFKAEFATLREDWQAQLIERKDELKRLLTTPVNGQAFVPPNFEGMPS